MIRTKTLFESTRISRITTVVLLLLSGFLFTECKRSSKGEEMLGSEYKPASADFNITGGAFQAYSIMTDAATETAAFQTDSVFFKAKFNEAVSWTITITGLQSKAYKTINGLSDTINVSNSLWDGGPSSVNFFRKNEQAVAVLSVLGSAITLKDTFTVTTTKVYHNKKINGVYHFFIEGFEGVGSGGLVTEAPSHDFADDPYVYYGLSQEQSIDGTTSYWMAGTDVNSNSWLVGRNTNLIVLLKPVSGGTQPRFTVTDPTQFYVNIHIYGTGKINTSIGLKLYEQETFPGPTIQDNYQQNTNDGYTHQINVNWTGWRLVSIPYSAFTRASDPAAGGAGNGIKEPWKVSALAFDLGSYPTPGKEVEAYVDYIILTENGRFKP